MVEYTPGGRVVAGSSPVIPTQYLKDFQEIGGLFLALNGVFMRLCIVFVYCLITFVKQNKKLAWY